MNMIERVAAAIEDVQLFINIVGSEELQICRHNKDGGYHVVSSHPYDADGVVELRQAVRDERAKAAIEAMRDPTEDMLDAVTAFDQAEPLSNETMTGVFNNMIDAALESK